MNASSSTVMDQQNEYIVENSGFVSQSPLMQDIFNKVERIARLEQHIILIGEIGTGKKRLAHIIHKHSPRAHGPFHSYYCVGINETELKESFWEQIHFDDEHLHLEYDVLEKARNGILFLDQFTDLSESYKNKMIESYIRGCNQLYRFKPDIAPRLIISIRQEEYPRFNKTEVWKRMLGMLNPISIMLPPLRERVEDIPHLIDYFLNQLRTEEPGWTLLGMTREAINSCMAYSWPGNVRQLKNAVMQGAVLSKGKRIDNHHLPFSMQWNLPYNF